MTLRPRSRVLIATTAFFLLGAGVALAQQQPTAREVFTPVSADAALIQLRGMLGCVVDAVWTSSECTDDRPFTIALSIFNTACLVLGSFFICSLIFSAVADTAQDGVAFGKATNTQTTIARVCFALFLALPVKNGMSLAQVAVVQIAVMGSGAADHLWSTVASSSLNGMYGTVPSVGSDQASAVTRGNLARTLQQRVYGYVCAASLENYAANLGRKDIKIEPKSTTLLDATPYMGGYFSTGDAFDAEKAYRATQYYFRDVAGYFRNSTSLCGTVDFRSARALVKATPLDGEAPTQLINLTQDIGYNAFTDAMATIEASAPQIAQLIVADAGAGRNENQVKAAIAAAVSSAGSALSSATTSKLNSAAATIQASIHQFIADSAANGWMTAVLWQRSLAAAYASISAAAEGAMISAPPPPPIETYIPFLDRYGGAYASLTDKAARDIAYFRTFDGFFASFARPGPTVITADRAVETVDGPGILSGAITATYQSIISAMTIPDGSPWQDPVIEVQRIGDSITNLAVVAGGLTAASALGSNILSAGDKTQIFSATLSFVASGMGWITVLLAVASFLLVGVVPLILVVHFFYAIFNWLQAILLALIAVPIWLLTKLSPARSASFIGTSSAGYLFALSIFLRPALTVLGLLAALLLMRQGLSVANILFRGALTMLAPTGTISSIQIAIAAIVVYATIVFSVVVLSASLITTLTDSVMRWFSGQLPDHGSAITTAAAVVAGAALPTQVRLPSGAGGLLAKGRSLLQQRKDNPSPPQPNPPQKPKA